MSKLDRSKPFGVVCGGSEGHAFEQDGRKFDQDGNEISLKRADALKAENERAALGAALEAEKLGSKPSGQVAAQIAED